MSDQLGYNCEVHGLRFEKRNWCPQCEIEFGLNQEVTDSAVPDGQ